jgi:phage shock protein B
MDGVIVAFFVPAIVFLIFVAPFWIFMHYRSKQRSRHELTARERELLEDLITQADRMVDRIETLEAILDSETPDWRRRTQRDGYDSAGASVKRPLDRGVGT